MAKDLPYFKFFVSEWNDGDITLEDYEAQGLFINICSYYWSNECNLSFKKTMKKFKDADYDLFKALIDSDIIKVEDDELIISFLDEQQGERLEQSKIKRKGGLASAEARRLKKLEQKSNTIPTEKQHVLKSCSTESQLLREEKRREEEIREDKIKEIEIIKEDYLKDDRLVKAILGNKETGLKDKKNLEFKLNAFNKMLSSKGIFSELESKYKSYFLNWLRNKKTRETPNKGRIHI